MSYLATAGLEFFAACQHFVDTVTGLHQVRDPLLTRPRFQPFLLVGVEGWHSIDAFPDAETVPGVVVYRWEAPLFFANAGAFRQQVRTLVRERSPSWVVVQCEAITDIDVTAAEMLEQLDVELNAADIHMAFAEMRDRLQDVVLRYGLLETLDGDHFYPTLEAALEDITSGTEPGG